MGRIVKFRQPKPKEERLSYYLYDRTVLTDPQANGKVGGVKLVARGDEHVVLMTSEQAKYWVTQGVIGTAPRGSLSGYVKKMHEQMFGNA